MNTKSTETKKKTADACNENSEIIAIPEFAGTQKVASAVSVAARIHIDECGITNGAVKVLPRTHYLGATIARAD